MNTALVLMKARRQSFQFDGLSGWQSSGRIALIRDGQALIEQRNKPATEVCDLGEGMSSSAFIRDAYGLASLDCHVRRTVPPGRVTDNRR